jgi:hypothetical protein
MSPTYTIAAPDALSRDVLVAVELFDPIAQAIVYRGFTVGIAGLTGRPIISRSGRFVWLKEGNAWPGAITVTPDRVPFAPHVAPAPPLPADPVNATPAERRIRIVLRPTAAYGFDAGITAVRGSLVEDTTINGAAVPGALVQLAWHDREGDEWIPAPPSSITASPQESETDRRGEFAAFLRLVPALGSDPDLDNGMLKVRLQLTRNLGGIVTRATAGTFRFLPIDQAPEGRVPQGQVLARDVKLAWSDLSPL